MLRPTSLAAALLLGALATTGCAPAAPPPPAADSRPALDAPADLAAIKAAREGFMAAYAAGDAAAIGQLYTENAVSEPNHQPSLKGRDAIVASLEAMFAQVMVKATLTPDETRTLGAVGLDRGRYSVTVTPKAGAPPTTTEGRYLVVYVKGEDGKWRVSHDIDNAPGVPAAPPAPAATDAAQPVAKP
ncbi:SgcJ/EcaC family oxidoreductase [Luteitalea sp. TBR-22]|uniref:YybH family protein n=1 Tax=Luteitalea sp. TBR-22 TaxID=2802971 RepID=UPI001EF4A579|nr:SgcJ/EcaC family oxidoreductase [Luteitalea sp. TBR-22]